MIDTADLFLGYRTLAANFLSRRNPRKSGLWSGVCRAPEKQILRLESAGLRLEGIWLDSALAFP